MSTRSVARSPSISVASAVSCTVAIGRSLAAAIARLSRFAWAPIEVLRKSWSSPSSRARARAVRSFVSCAELLGGGVGVALGLVSEAVFFVGEGELPPLSPQAAKATATAARAVQRVMATGEHTMSGFPTLAFVSPLSNAKVVR